VRSSPVDEAETFLEGSACRYLDFHKKAPGFQTIPDQLSWFTPPVLHWNRKC
jgi:hypothetical protein